MRTYSGDEDVLLITNEGIIIRFSAANISITGRDTQGVRLMRLDDDKYISTMSIVQPDDEEDEDVDPAVAGSEGENQAQALPGEMKDVESMDNNDELPTEVEELLDRAEADEEDSEDDE